jgi:hypothetical protein
MSGVSSLMLCIGGKTTLPLINLIQCHSWFSSPITDFADHVLYEISPWIVTARESQIDDLLSPPSSSGGHFLSAIFELGSPTDEFLFRIDRLPVCRT